ncbi:MAG: hypothetical protein R2795_19155 [Saprospiraceae bacterium]
MKPIYTLLLVLWSAFGWSQILEPVKWDMSSKHLSGNEYELIFTARMDAGWSIYSQYTDDIYPFLPPSISMLATTIPALAK